MNSTARIVRFYLRIFPFFVLCMASSGPAVGQIPVDDDGNSLVSDGSAVVRNDGISTQLPALTASELEELVGPIALYPDNLLAIVLPASTYPLQVVLAARFLEQLESDDTLTPDETLDESVIALLNYPEVVQMMNENIQWTWQLGEAIVNQEVDVLTAIGTFRDSALAAGNLNSDEYQNVTSSGDNILITQKDETVVYVPYYVPEEVIVYQPQPVYHYYPTAHSVYYYPYRAGHRFISDYFWGVTTAFAIGWSDFRLHVYHPSYSRHPYYGRQYYSGHRYRRPNIRAFNRFYVDNNRRIPGNRFRDGSYWRAQAGSGRSRAYSTANERTVPNQRRGNRGLNTNRRASTDRPARAAITNNNAGTGSFRGSSGRAGNRRDTNSNGNNRSSVNTFTNSTASGSNSAATGRARSRGNTNRSTVDSRRGGGRAGNQVSNQNGSAANAAITNNNAGTRSFRGSSGRTGNRRGVDSSSNNRPSVNTFTNSTASGSGPAATGRARSRGNTNRSTVDGRRGRGGAGNQVLNQIGSAANTANSSQQGSSRIKPAQQRSAAPQSTRNSRAVNRLNPRRATTNRSQRAVPTETRRRGTVQSQPRQRSAERTGRRDPANNNRQSSAPVRSRNTRSSSVSRGTPSTARTPNNSGRVRSRGSRRSP